MTETVDTYRPGQPKKAAASGWIGSALEYYDFFIYTQAAALVFPTIFFPKDDARMGIIGALGTYAVGYLFRPIGAFVLGSWGDKHGRKNVLVLCMLVMGATTFLIALLPTYQQVGFLAPSLLMLLRIIQGFVVAGEISGASSMILEHAPFGRRGYFGSFALQGTQFGQILAAAVFLPMAHFLSKDAFESWGWRVPFLLSIFVVAAGYFIRRRVEETPEFTEEVAEGKVEKSPISEVFKETPGAVLRVFGMQLFNIIAVTTSVFGATYATNKSYGINMHKDVYLWIPILGNIAAVAVIPFVGNLSDKIGRRPPMLVATATCGLMSFAYLWAVSQNNVPLAIVFSILMWGILYQGLNAVYPAFYPEQFPTHTRVTGMAIGQNFGTAASSAMAIVFAAVAPGGSNVVLIVGSLTLVICLISFVCVWLSPETYRIPRHELGEPGATPIPKDVYDKARAEAMAEAKAGR